MCKVFFLIQIIMNNSAKKKIWQKPWGYPESIIVVVGIYLVGVVLQLTNGSFNFSNLAWPINAYFGGFTILLVGIVAIKRSQFFSWLSSIPLSVTLICALLIETLIMGITPQFAGQLTAPPTVFDLLGFTKMTSSWPFVLVFYFTIVALEAAILNRVRNFKWSDYPFYLNHIGLLIMFLSAGLGASDMKRYVMYVEEGKEQAEWRVYSEKNDVLELPIAIRLEDFTMEEYLPKLTIIHRNSGKSIPYENPSYLQIENTQTVGTIADYTIRIDSFYNEAVRHGDHSYRMISMPGSCPAAYVSIKNKALNIDKKGWVCGGNYAQLYMPIALNDTLSLVMTRPEPKHYASKVEVFSKSGVHTKAIIEVNKPLEIDNWTIYQYGYDTDAGKASSYSSFELVYDPWLDLVYTGIALIALGSFSFLWVGNRKRKEKKQ